MSTLQDLAESLLTAKREIDNACYLAAQTELRDVYDNLVNAGDLVTYAFTQATSARIDEAKEDRE